MLGVVQVSLLDLATDDTRASKIKAMGVSRRDTMMATMALAMLLVLTIEVTSGHVHIIVTGSGIETTITLTEGLVDITTTTAIGFSADSIIQR
jgi:hypothetical protein